MLALVRTDFAPQGVQRVPRLAQHKVEPALDGREAYLFGRAANGMTPGLDGELLELPLQLAPVRWGGQYGPTTLKRKRAHFSWERKFCGVSDIGWFIFDFLLRLPAMSEVLAPPGRPCTWHGVRA